MNPIYSYPAIDIRECKSCTRRSLVNHMPVHFPDCTFGTRSQTIQKNPTVTESYPGAFIGVRS